MKKLYLICGVPGSGKSWVLSQVADKFICLENDSFIGKDYTREIAKKFQSTSKPVVADCPFGERFLRDKLESLGVSVEPIFIVEKPEVVKKRYEEREGKPIPQAHLTRAKSILTRANEWGAFFGTSEEVANYLKACA